ncbi:MULTISPECIES: hypothetical protein [Priestia]|uniref:hypothetical protein n=2 Tax=Bacillales TaxID=1385 RepID=UPI00129473E0|nr:hypothetical protein [Priestia flexa]
MMGFYPKEEQETLLLYDAVQKQWKFRCTSKQHIDQLTKVGEVTRAYTDDDGMVIDIEGYLAPSQVRLYNVPSEKQQDHLAKMRARRLND